MKDPASDFLLKHQPPEYYKCHLHAVLEKEVDEVGGERKMRKEVDVTLVMKPKLLDGMECLYLFAVWKAEVWDLSHCRADLIYCLTILDLYTRPSDTEQHVFIMCSCVSDNPKKHQKYVNIYSLEQLLDVGTILQFNQYFYFFQTDILHQVGTLLTFDLLSLERTAHQKKKIL